MWLAQVGRERIEEVIDPELTIERALETYAKKGYSREWINQRLQAIQVRKELTDEWDKRGVKKGVEYAILTDEDDKPVACVAIRKISDETCEGKRLFIKPEYRGKGYARVMIKAMTDIAFELGFNEVVFTTKPEVMTVGYGLYKRMGFEELSEEDGIVSMRIDLSLMK